MKTEQGYMNIHALIPASLYNAVKDKGLTYRQVFQLALRVSESEDLEPLRKEIAELREDNEALRIKLIKKTQND